MKVDVRYVKFIKSALSDHSLNLLKPFVATVEGRRWLCSCDGHRLHAVPVAQTVANGYVVLDDIDGSFASIGFDGAAPPPVAATWCAGRAAVHVATDHLKLVSLARETSPLRGHGLSIVFDAKAVPRVRVPWQKAAPTDVGLDPRYVADAVRHWGIGDHEESVMVGLADPLSPVVFEAPATMETTVPIHSAAVIPAWRAVIMPVRL